MNPFESVKESSMPHQRRTVSRILRTMCSSSRRRVSLSIRFNRAAAAALRDKDRRLPRRGGGAAGGNLPDEEPHRPLARLVRHVDGAALLLHPFRQQPGLGGGSGAVQALEDDEAARRQVPVSRSFPAGSSMPSSMRSSR